MTRVLLAPVRPPHLHRDWARRCHICAGTGLTRGHIFAGTGLTPCHVCAGTGTGPPCRALANVQLETIAPVVGQCSRVPAAWDGRPLTAEATCSQSHLRRSHLQPRPHAADPTCLLRPIAPRPCSGDVCSTDGAAGAPPMPHLHRDWARPAATSAPGLRSWRSWFSSWRGWWRACRTRSAPTQGARPPIDR
jgi:hypothetical protein